MNEFKKTNDIGPALLLMLLAPLLTEVLPGATRFSSIFVLPIEICVWGGGSLLIRYAVRRWKLGWLSMLFLAFALVLAEEFIIQQTSIAPMVIRLKGETYARAAEINYVYFVWALLYESTFVVFVPIVLVEMIFPARKERGWISKAGFFVIFPLFLLGSLLAWFSWTRIARPKVFHMPVYHPPVVTTAVAVLLMAGLIYFALSGIRSPQRSPFRPPASWLLILSGAVWASLLFGIVLLGFGIDPAFPPAVAVAGGVALFVLPCWLLPAWTAHPDWGNRKRYSLLLGVMAGSWLIGYLGFIGTGGKDLYFKVITNIIAFGLLIWLGRKVWQESKTVNHAIQS